ncbi:hypothetical protein [Brucella sp.]|uniref:hypothetical protein n=1 Tax=Brucella sp. TaxID=52132 RepID=UPI0028B1C0BC|nr:hypothetical protein [Brucella sp.]
MKAPKPIRKRGSVRTPIPFVDAYGKQVLKVPLDDAGADFALIDAADYQRLIDSGITPNWFKNGDGQGRTYVRAGLWRDGKGTVIQIARAVLKAEGRRVVHYLNGDSLDLRMSNLRLSKCRDKNVAMRISKVSADHG